MPNQVTRRQWFQRMGIGSAAVCFSAGIRAAGADAPGRTYYVDPAAGDDAHDGVSPETPLKTHTSRTFTGGDSVLFKRGGVIREGLLACNGTESAPVVYGAYGEGPKPAFLGSIAVGDAGKWVEERPSLWRYVEPMPSEVCNLIFDGGASCGTLRWTLEEVRAAGEWHYTGFGGQDKGGGTLYLGSTENPGQAYASIECALWGRRRLAGGERNIVLENLSFQNSGVHGYQEWHARNVVLRGCDFRFIGGAVWNRERRIRFGNAVELWEGASEVRVERCRFDNIYDSAVTHQGGGVKFIPERIHFQDNLFTNIGLAAYESREPGREVYFEHNTCVNAGGGFSMQGECPPRQSDPYPQPVGYHVWAWMIEPGTQAGKIYVRNNIFYESYGPAVCLSVAPEDARLFALENNVYWKTTQGRLIEWGGGTPYTSEEFGKFQTACGCEQSGCVARPEFNDVAKGDFRVRAGSRCSAAGVRWGDTE